VSVPAETALDLLVALLRDGLDFYRFAQHRTQDREVSAAFGLAAEVRGLMLKDLQRAGAIGDPAREQPVPIDDPALRYVALRDRLDATHPESVAAELRRRETTLSQLVETLFKGHPSPGVRRVMKNYFPRVKHCAEMMRRLSHRGDVAA
jgi:hypothetical protein